MPVPTRQRIPHVVPVLAACVFVVGTSEFMIAGLLPEMAAELSVTIPQAGYLISAFAIGMVVGAPAMAMLTLRVPRRTTLVAALAVVAGGQFAGAVAPTYAVMIAARVVTAVAVGAFWAVASVVIVTAVERHDRARALSVMFAGLTVANVVGIPLGTLAGQQFGWRAPFWAVGALAAVGVVGVLISVPDRVAGAAPPRLAVELAVFRHARMWVAIATVVVYDTAVIGVISYLAPLLTDVAALDPSWVPVVQFGFGVGGFVGAVIGGRVTDSYPWATLFGSLAAVAVLLLMIGLFAPVRAVLVGSLALLGVVAFVIALPLNARIFALAGSAPTLAGAATTSAFNVGNTLGPALGGAAIAAGFGYTAPAWLGAALALGATALALTSRHLDRRA